ncbi:kinase [Halomonas campisalis]|uniref:kinase n=1 Tax=Billgrantia campisalis TaxID=74661 RepID=UPI001EF157D1|nr:kinase [Halomonas campisalis]MDR5862928.1 kinase [Halomonas campisalis]
MALWGRVVTDALGKQRKLGKRLARGGEGEIFALQGRPDVIVKWYYPEVLDKRGDELHRKVEAMRELRDSDMTQDVCWPLIRVFDDRHRWIGFAMYRARGVKMGFLAHALLYERYFPNLDRRQIVGYLIRFIEIVQQLHRAGICIGDYNLNNVYCVPGSGQVTLIDCDSYQLRVAGTFYPCPVGSPDMTPKEHQGVAFRDIVRNPQSEAFSLAIVLFKCLMLGRHPYDIVGGDDPVRNLRRGNFAYGRGQRDVPEGAWYELWSELPEAIRDMFVTTFTEGANVPSRRATLAQWHAALETYRQQMDQGECARRLVKPGGPPSSGGRHVG